MADLVRILVPVLVVVMVLGLGFYSLFTMEEAETAYAPWPMDGGDSRNDCLSPYSADGPPFTLDWELEIESPYMAYPMIMGPGDKIFFRVQNQSTYVNDYIYCVDSDGSIIWTAPSVTEFYRYPLVLGPDLSLYAAEGQNVSRYDMNGQMSWSVEVGQEPWLTVAEERIHVFTEGRLTALLLNGTQDWALELEEDARAQSVPAVGDDGTIHVAYYTHNDGYDKVFLAVNPNGTVKWKTSISHGSYQSGVWFNPVVAPNGTVYHYDNGHLMAFDSDGAIIWNLAFEGEAYTAALGKEGTVYLAESGFTYEPGHVHAISPGGELLWTYEASVNSSIFSIVIDDGGTLLFGGYGGIFALDQEGNLKWSYAVEDNVYSIVVGEEGSIYFMRYDDSGTVLGKISGSG